MEHNGVLRPEEWHKRSPPLRVHSTDSLDSGSPRFVLIRASTRSRHFLYRVTADDLVADVYGLPACEVMQRYSTLGGLIDELDGVTRASARIKAIGPAASLARDAARTERGANPLPRAQKHHRECFRLHSHLIGRRCPTIHAGDQKVSTLSPFRKHPPKDNTPGACYVKSNRDLGRMRARWFRLKSWDRASKECERQEGNLTKRTEAEA